YVDPAPPRRPGGTATRIPFRGTNCRPPLSWRGGSIFVALVFFLVFVPVVLVILIVVPVVVLVFFLFFVLVLFGLGPAFRLVDPIEVHLMPGLEIDLLDLAIEILDLDQLRVLIYREDTE